MVDNKIYVERANVFVRTCIETESYSPLRDYRRWHMLNSSWLERSFLSFGLAEIISRDRWYFAETENWGRYMPLIFGLSLNRLANGWRKYNDCPKNIPVKPLRFPCRQEGLADEQKRIAQYC